VAVTVLVPVLVPLFKVTAATPKALVTALEVMVPSTVEKLTVAPAMGVPPTVLVRVADMAEVVYPLAVMEAGLAPKVKVMPSKVTVVVWASLAAVKSLALTTKAWAVTVAIMFAVEAVLFNVAVAIPAALVTALAVMVPELVAKTMVCPEMGLVPSVSVAVMAELDTPLANIEAGEDDRVSTVPASPKTTEVWARACPQVAVMLAVPVLVELVNLAVAMPAVLVVALVVMVPKVVAKLTEVPACTGLP